MYALMIQSANDAAMALASEAQEKSLQPCPICAETKR